MLGVLAVFVLTVLDPLGFETITKSQSSKIFYKVYAPAYPSFMRDNISVVLLDNNTVEKTYNDTWPPSYRVHGAALDAILSFKPAAVLVDIVFLHKPTEEDRTEMEDIAKNYHDKSVSFFLVVPGAATGARRLGGLYDDPKFKENVSFVSAELEEEPGQASLYPLDSDTFGNEPAALALYHKICSASLVKDATCSDAPSRGWLDEHIIEPVGEWLSLFPQEKGRADLDVHNQMEVVWGLVPGELNCRRAEHNADISNLTCKDLGRTWLGRAIELLWEGIYPAQRRNTDPMLIPYHSEISTTDLFKGENYKELAKALAGKIVIYSSQVTPRKDLVFTPVHDNIDGVFVHAMALDNLLTWGEKSVIRRAPEGWFHKDRTEFEPLILMTVVALFLSWHRRSLVRVDSPAQSVEELQHRDERVLRWITWLLYPVVIVLGLYQFLEWRIAPFNWLGMLIVIHVAHLIDKWFFKTVEREAHDAGWSRTQETREKLSERAA
jgi:CHASE2 domain